MAVTEETARLILETIGADGIQNLRDKVKALPAEMGELTAALGRGEIEIEEYDREAKKLATTYKQLSGALDQLEKKTGTAGNKMAGLGQAGLQTGRVIQDFAQGGIGGILNNIEGFTQAVGGGPGLAGVLTLLGVGFFALKPQIKGFIDSLRTGDVVKFGESIEDLKARIKELTDKPIKLLTDLGELDTAKEKLKGLEEGERAFQAAKEGKSLAEKEAGDAVKKLLADHGDVLAKAQQDIMQQLITEKANTPAIRKAQKEKDAAAKSIASIDEQIDQQPLMNPEQRFGLIHAREIEEAKQKKAEEALSAAAAANRKQAEAEFGAMLTGAQAGNNPAAQAELVGRLRRAGAGELAGKVEAETPQAIDKKARKKAKDEEDKYWAEAAREADAAAKEVVDAQHKAVKVALEPILKAGDLKANVAKAIKDAETLFGGMSKERRYEEVKKLVEAELKRRLGEKGVENTRDSGDLISAAATQLLGQGKGANAKDDTAAKRDATKQAAAAAKVRADQVRGANVVGREAAARAKAMDGMQARNEAILAQQIAAGRMGMDAGGKLSAGGFDQLVKSISAQLRQQAPGMKPLEAASLAQRLASNVEKGVGGKFLEQAGMGLNAQMATQNVVMQTQQAVAALANKVMQVQARNAQLARNNAGLRKQIQAPGPNNLPAGGP